MKVSASFLSSRDLVKDLRALDFNKYSKEEIRDAFIEFSMYPCPFKDCMHIKEKECIVKQEVISNNILDSRYTNYLSFIG